MGENGSTGFVATYGVDGMTCGHCASAVQAEVGQLAGVSSVSVDLHPGETSVLTVTSAAPLSLGELTTALEEAGDYQVV